MNFKEILLHQHWLLSLVFLVLILISFASWFLIFRKFFFFRSEFSALRSNSHKALNDAFSLVISGQNSEILSKKLSLIFETYKDRLQFGQNFLASIANLSPFIGLFGTVIGVYFALIDIAASGSANISVVAKPIGESLIATAIGLWCAIPASFAYNFYAKKSAFLIRKMKFLIEEKSIKVAENEK